MRRVLALALLLLAPVRAEDDRPDRRVSDPKLQARINRAIDAGVAYLRRVQGKDGSWPYAPPGQNAAGDHYDGGITALALYALAASRVPADDPAIARGVRWTERHRIAFGTSGSRGTYCASLLVLALTRIDPKRHATRIESLAGRLVDAQLKSDMWTYQLGSRTGRGVGRKGGGGAGRGRGGANGRPGGRIAAPMMRGDNSNSQFAVLALWAATALADVEVPVATWQRIAELYRRTQLPAGGWSYHGRANGRRFGGGSPTMTAAGLVSYVYANAALLGGAAALPAARRMPVARKGLAAFLEGPRPFSNYYFVYSLERVGTVLAVPAKQWYDAGARKLIAAQQEDGSWRPRRPGHGDAQSVYETSLALLFLSRATAYSITPGGDSRPAGRQAATRPRDEPPASLERLFREYVRLGPDGRARRRAGFGRAGPESVGLFVRKLASKDAATRRAAAELLAALVERPFLFEPDRPASERKLMIVPIENFWRRHGRKLRWDAGRGLFVLND